MSKHRLRVIRKVPQANDAVTVILQLSQELQDQFQYLPGQFLTLEFVIAGKSVRRAYSLSSCPSEDTNLHITVKRIQGGLVSNHIHERLKVGDMVVARPASGKFCVRTDSQNYKSYYLFAAGSGITPLLSIMRTVLSDEPNSHLFLFYGNRNEESIIFHDLLTELSRTHRERLKVVHTLSRPKRDDWSSLWRWDGVDWSVRKGRIDEEAIRWFFAKHPPIAQDAHYFICGPGNMIESVTAALMTIGVPEPRIHQERFATNAKVSHVVTSGVVSEATLVAQIDGSTSAATVARDQSLLRCLLANGVDAPYSCESGVCGTCKAKLIAGTVHRGSIAGLAKSELDNGFILTCQARPTSQKVELQF